MILSVMLSGLLGKNYDTYTIRRDARLSTYKMIKNKKATGILSLT